MLVRSVEGDGEGAALLVGFAGEVEEAEGAVAVFGGDGEWGLAEDGVADVGVELAVVAGDGGDAGAGELGGVLEVERKGDGAPGGFGFGEPGLRVSRARAGGGVGSARSVGSCGSTPNLRKLPWVPWTRKRGDGLGGEHGGVAGVAQGAAVGHVVVEDEVEGVVDVGAVAVVADGGGDARGRAEEREGLVDEVRAEVVEEAGGGAGDFFPGVGALERAVAVEAGDDLDDAAECAFGEELAEGEEVAVPAAVVEGREDAAVMLWRGRRGRCADFEDEVMGLSTTTCLPAWRAWAARSKWVSLGVATTMRSMLGSRKASSAERRMRAEG